MKQLGTEAFNEVRTWMYRNARPLELAMWQFYFEQGSRETALKCLGFYQNEDGGFGNCLEADSWNPQSSPYSTLIAIGMLRGMDFVDVNHPIYQGIFKYLGSGIHSSLDGWFFGIPSNDDYPHAPWWSYSEELNVVQNLGVTVMLCGFLLRYGDRQSKLFETAAGYADRILKKVHEVKDFGEMGAGGLGVLLQDIEAGGLTDRFDCSGIGERLMELANAAMERNPEKWAGYTPRPSEFIPSPSSPLYAGNEEIVETELNYLIDTRNPGGVWNITWSWFDLTEKYPKEFAISENWWMASKAIEKMQFLKNFDRL